MSTPIFPMRSFIRFQAKAQLMADINGQPVMTFIQRAETDANFSSVVPEAALDQGKVDVPPSKAMAFEESDNSSNDDSSNPVLNETVLDEAVLDEAVFGEVASIAFNENRHPELYQSCASREVAHKIEAVIVNEIVGTYKQIKQNQSNPVISALNSLL